MHEIIINNVDPSKKDILILENGNLIEKYIETEETERREGDICIGIVKDILQGMQAAFLRIDEDQNTFMNLRDILPKQDITVHQTMDAANINISDYIKPKQKVLIQVKRDKTNKKGARVSTHISLPGRYVVLMPEVGFITISQKIEAEEERKRLLKMIKENLPSNMGVILRTSAMGKSEEKILKDLKTQIEQWNKIKEAYENDTDAFPKLLYKSDCLEKKIILDLLDHDLERVTVNNQNTYEKILEILGDLNENNLPVQLRENEDLLNMYELKEKLEKLKQRKVWLNCGGFITIDKTEALTAIDVNSGKYTGTKNLEETVLTVNKEASIEIAKQLRLRDIGGIIIIDYIDMKEESSKEKILETFKKELKKDRSKTQIMGFTKLDLLEMTRKHVFGE